jgi:hypothetical protein
LAFDLVLALAFDLVLAAERLVVGAGVVLESRITGSIAAASASRSWRWLRIF